MHGTKRKYTWRVQIMIPRSMKNITRRSCDIIPMPDTVINRVTILGKYQEELLAFTYRKVKSLEIVVYISHEWMGMGMKMSPTKNWK